VCPTPSSATEPPGLIIWLLTLIKFILFLSIPRRTLPFRVFDAFFLSSFAPFSEIYASCNLPPFCLNRRKSLFQEGTARDFKQHLILISIPPGLEGGGTLKIKTAQAAPTPHPIEIL
jgi:hypothetical protein